MSFGQGRNRSTSQAANPERRSLLPLRMKSLGRLVAAAFVLLAVSAFAMQDSPALHAVNRNHAAARAKSQSQQEPPLTKEKLEQYKPLIDELGKLLQKIEQNVKLPAPRTQSKLLPLVPATSSFYVSFPNYGDVIHQVNQIFLEEVKVSPVLNDWWQNKVGMVGPMVEDGIEKFYQFTQYLGNEVAFSGTVTQKSGSVLFIAEARKPGLKAFIDQIVKQYAPQPKPPVRVLTPQQLLTAKAQRGIHYKPLLILVRPDYVVASTELATLQSFNAQLTRGGGRFTSFPFGQRLAQTYPPGAVIVGGVDLQKILALRPHGSPESEKAFEQSGFADMKYLIAESRYENETASSNLELSFNGPRHGIASWLAAPSPLPGLDFISNDAAYAVAITLKPLGQIFEEARQMGENVNPFAGVAVAQAESELKINLKDDLFSKFGGQLTFALDGPITPVPSWKAIAQVSDPNGLQQTIKQLLIAANASAKPANMVKLDQQTEGGLNYYTLRFGDSAKAVEVHYAFTDGYMIAGGNRAIVKDAIGLHRNGNSLSRSSDFQALVPSEHSGQASALLYENPVKFLSLVMSEVSPDLKDLLLADAAKSKGIVAAAYADDTTIRSVTRSRGFDVGTMLVVAAIAIPNIMRSRNAANEAAALATVRTVNTVQAQYIADYNKGYAPDLSTLASCEGQPSVAHACLLDDKMGCPSDWCTKNSFRYNLTGVCKQGQCDNYVVVATPVSASDGGRSFCSTSDGVVHARPGMVMDPINASECEAWPPL